MHFSISRALKARAFPSLVHWKRALFHPSRTESARFSVSRFCDVQSNHWNVILFLSYFHRGADYFSLYLLATFPGEGGGSDVHHLQPSMGLVWRGNNRQTINAPALKKRCKSRKWNAVKVEQINRSKRPGMKYFLFFLSEVNLSAKSVALSKRKGCSELFFRTWAILRFLFCIRSVHLVNTSCQKNISVLV